MLAISPVWVRMRGCVSSASDPPPSSYENYVQPRLQGGFLSRADGTDAEVVRAMEKLKRSVQTAISKRRGRLEQLAQTREDILAQMEEARRQINAIEVETGKIQGELALLDEVIAGVSEQDAPASEPGPGIATPSMPASRPTERGDTLTEPVEQPDGIQEAISKVEQSLQILDRFAARGATTAELTEACNAAGLDVDVYWMSGALSAQKKRGIVVHRKPLWWIARHATAEEQRAPYIRRSVRNPEVTIKEMVWNDLVAAGAEGLSRVEAEQLVKERRPETKEGSVGSLLSKLKNSGAALKINGRYVAKPPPESIA